MSGSASNPGQMAGVACGSYAPHTYLKNKCRDCGHPEAEHPAKPAADAGAAAANGNVAGADWQSAAAAAGAAPDVAAFEQLSVADAGALNVLKDNKDCAQYKPHAWIYDRCRECGCSESSHLRGADGSKLVDVAPPEASGHRSALGVLRAQSVMNKDGIPIERQVQVSEPGKIDLHAREEALFAAQRSASGSVDKGANGSVGGHAPHTGGRLDVADIPSGAPPMAMSPTQKRAEQDMQNIVAKMTYFERQKNLVAQADAAKLADKQITQEEFDRREKELQEAFARKEAEVKAEAELARQALEDANEAHRREVEAAAAMQIKEAQEAARRQVEEAQAQTRQLLEDAEREKAAAQEFKRQAEDARAAAQADALLQKQLADAALAEAQQSKSESERQRLEAEERLRAAQEAMASEKEAAAAAAAARELAKDEEQPTGPGGAGASATPTIVAREGDVTLSDVLKNVERLFQQGRNVIRYTGNKPPTFSSIFIRELAPADASPAVGGAPAQVLYSICWSKADERLVDPSRSLDFGDISAVVLGKQSTVLKSQANLPNADDAHCVSFIAGSKCPKRSLHLQFGNERDRDTWAYGIASLMKEFGVKPSVFEPGQYFEHESEKAKDYELNPSYVEEDDGSLPASEKDVHSLATAAREQARYQIELSCKAANLPSVHKNTIVCLVDRNERTNKLEYLNQTERVAGTNTPAFKKKFPLHFVDSAAKTLRFNVYDVPEGSKNIEDECRLGCAIVQIKALVDKPGAEFVYALSHKHPKRQAALTAAQSTLTVSCASRKLISSAVNDSGSGVGSSAGADDAHKALLTQLRLTEKQLAQGDTFTNHVEGVGEQTITLLYTRGTAATAGGPPSLSRPTSIASSGAPTTPTSTDAAPAAAAAGGSSTPTPSASGAPASDRFELGSLTWSTVGAAPQSVPLRSIVDVFVGKKHRVFPADARDEHCFSLVSRTGVRLDLEAKSKGQRDQWVQGIISFLQAAAAQQQKDRQRAASVSAGGTTPARSTTPSPAAGGAAAAAASPASAAPPQA